MPSPTAKPTPDRFPADLRARPQWVVWRLEQRDGKQTKVPYAPATGRHASTTDPSTWSDFETAVVMVGSVFDGLGFVFTPDDGVIGIDLDHVRDPASGAMVEWAEDVLNACGSYAELSPSGTGVHIYIRGVLPENVRHRQDQGAGHIEVYDQGRFFTVTGHALTATRAITEPVRPLADILSTYLPAPPSRPAASSRPAVPVDLDDTELLKRARTASNGPKFARLWGGDCSDYGDDQSRADLGLCGMLAFYTGADRERIDRLFRRSGLMRDKWDSSRGASTYGADTIAEACAGCTEFYTPPRRPVTIAGASDEPLIVLPTSTPAASGRWIDGTLTVSELLVAPDPELVWYEDRVLSPGIITELFSPRGLGKTNYAYAIAVKIAKSGTRVLLLDRDNPSYELKRRLRAWGAEQVDNFEVRLRQDVPPLTDRAAWAAFPYWRWGVVIIDSFDSSTEGIGEKDTGKPSLALKPLLDLAHRDGGPAILVLGNTTKDGSQGRGTGLIQDRADICFEVRDATGFTPDGPDWWTQLPDASGGAWAERISRRKERELLRLAFSSTKFRVGPEPRPWIIELDFTTTPWSIRDVTAEVESGATARAKQVSEAKQAELDTAADSLLAELVRRDGPMVKRAAEEFLCAIGLRQKQARELIDAGGQGRWLLRPTQTTHGGSPVGLYPREGGQ